MPNGIRASVVVEGVTDCPLVSVLGSAESTTRLLSRTVVSEDGGTVCEEFALEDEPELDEESIEPVIEYGAETVYRLTRSRDCGCVCDQCEYAECTVTDVKASGDQLYLTVHAADRDAFKDALTRLEERDHHVTTRRLVGNTEYGGETDFALVDRNRLTARQRETLTTAYEMGYFERQRDANAGEVASELRISSTTFRRHLRAAQSKVLGAILDR